MQNHYEPLSRRKRVAFTVGIVLLTVTLGLIGAELAVRTVKQFGHSTFVFRQYDPQLGTALIAGSRGRHQRCYDGYVAVNAHGMRDRERTVHKPIGTFRIGIFGDSFTEAVHVQPSETAPSLLEQRLNRDVCDGRCEVLNFSVASFSTVQEYLQYTTLGRWFDLDLVVLVTIPNDLIANIDPGHSSAGSFYHAPFLEEASGAWQLISAQRPRWTTAVVARLARTSDLVLYLSKIYRHTWGAAHQGDAVQTASVLYDGKSKAEARGVPPIFGLYDTTVHKGARAWEALDLMLHRFSAAATADGASFAVAFIEATDAFWWYPTAGQADGTELDFELGKRRFERFAAETGTKVKDLGVALADYIHAHRLAPPYLSLPCDPHFGSHGQSVVADTLFEFLTKSQLVRPPTPPTE